MVSSIRPRWAKHLLGCQRKGREAFLRGESRDSCPYQVHNEYHSGPANLTKQRRWYWIFGWDQEERETAMRERLGG